MISEGLLSEEEKGALVLNGVVPMHLMMICHKMSEVLIRCVDLLD